MARRDVNLRVYFYNIMCIVRVLSFRSYHNIILILYYNITLTRMIGHRRSSSDGRLSYYTAVIYEVQKQKQNARKGCERIIFLYTRHYNNNVIM